jgi:hypothetical protein
LAKGQWRKKYDEAPGNGWSQETILLVEAWMRRAAHMEKSYVQKAKRATLMNQIIMISYIVLVAVCGGVEFFEVDLSYQGYPVSYILKLAVIVGCLTVAAGIFASLNGFFKFVTRVSDYKYAANKFSRIVRKIEAVIHADNSDRPPAKEFIQDISEKYSKYQDSGEFIVEEILNIQGLKSQIVNDVNQNNDQNNNQVKDTQNVVDDSNSSDEDINFKSVVATRLNLLDATSTNNIAPELNDIKDIDFVDAVVE